MAQMPLASSSTSPPSSFSTRSPAQYHEDLQQLRITLEQLPETPPSRPSSPSNIAKLNTLRNSVVEAYTTAYGDSSDGKWSHLAETLRLPCTRGRYKWSHASLRRPASPPVPPNDTSRRWFLAKTEKEWIDWEGKRMDEVHAREKVEKWKRGVQTQLEREHEPESSLVVLAVPSVKSSQESSSSTAALGFRVVKGSSAAKAKTKKSVQRINDIPETGFIPPSFPSSQIKKSTPYTSNKLRTKPAPIPHRIFPSSPATFPTHSSSLPQPSQPATSDVNKRQRPLTPTSDDNPETKKIRLSIVVPPSSGPGLTTPPASNNTTPHRNKLNSTKPKPGTLPTLTELLSAEKPRPPTIRKPVSTTNHAAIMSEHEEEEADKETVPVSDERKNTFPRPVPLPLELPQEQTLGGRGAPSPTKSLSSLAESDSPTPSPVSDKFPFEPLFESTRLHDRALGVYSSQFDVEGNVSRVDDLLREDVDFDLWLRDDNES